MGGHFPLQGIFLTQGSNPGLLHWSQTPNRKGGLIPPMLDNTWAPCSGNNRSSWFFKQHPKSCRIYIYLFFQFLILLPFEKLVSSCLRQGWDIKHFQPKSILRIQKSIHAHQLFSAPVNLFFIWDVKEFLFFFFC